MFIRKNKNKSDSTSISIIDKSSGRYKVIKTVGCADDEQGEKELIEQACELLPTLTKEKINNRGYNKYLKIKNEIAVEIDYKAFLADNKWNGLKGYITNCELSESEVMDNYKHQSKKKTTVLLPLNAQQQMILKVFDITC